MDTPVTPDFGEESVLCGTDIGRQTNGQVRTEVKEGPVEKNTGVCTKTRSGWGSPAVEEGEVLAELCLIAEEAEDAALALDPAQLPSITLDQTTWENVDFQASVGLPRTCFEDISEGSSIKKEPVEQSDSLLL